MRKILLAFKQWLNRVFRRGPYLCDPSKAVTCDKSRCWKISHGPCKCTFNKAYAKTDEKGRRVIASDLDIWNADFYEYWIGEMDKKI